MDSQDIIKMWEEDSPINIDDIARQSVDIPRLHAKYLKILSSERIILKKLIAKQKILAMTLQDYYEGRLDGRDIKREPFQYHITKGQAEKRVEADKEMIGLNLLIGQVEENILLLKDIITNINQRNWIFRNYIDYQKFLNGVGS